MKKIIFTLAATVALLLIGCTKDDLVPPGQAKNRDSHTLQLTADVPGESDTRVAMQKDPNDTKSIRTEWQANDLVNLGFLQDGAFATAQIKVSAVNTDGSAVFEPLTIPAAINPANPYVLYAAVNGTLSYVKSAVRFVCNPGLDVSLQSLSKRVPFYCRQDIPANAGEQRLRFRNIGSILSVHIKNTGGTDLPADMPTLTLSSGAAWYSIPSGFKVDAAVTNPTFVPTAVVLNMNVRGLSTLPAGNSTTAYAWIVPSELSPFNLNASIGYYATTTVSKTIGQKLPQGKNIHFYLQVNMDDYEENASPAKLEFVNGTNFGSINEDIPRITFTTNKAAGSTVSLIIDAEAADRPGIWIDLNNNGMKDAGEENIGFLDSSNSGFYTISSSTATVYGKVTAFSFDKGLTLPDIKIKTVDASGHTTLTSLQCPNNEITELNVSGATALKYLNCTGNRITALDVSQSPALLRLQCGLNELTALDVSQNTNLERLACYNNKLTALNISGSHNKLVRIECEVNSLTALDVSQCTALNYLYCTNNQISGGAMTTLVNSLVDRTGMEAGKFFVSGGGNVITDADIDILRSKNWNHW